MEDEYAYTYPVFRYGRICQSIEGLDFDTASSVPKLFENKRGTFIKEKLKNCFEDVGISCEFIDERELREKKKGLHLKYLEGPAVLFDHMRLQLNGFDGEYRPSLTVCSPPNHSKIWMRYSFVPNGNSGGRFELTQSNVKNFFDIVQNVSNEVADLLLEEYKSALIQKSDSIDIKVIYTVIIKTVASNDDTLKKLIQQASSFEVREIMNAERVLKPVFYWVTRNNDETISDIMAKEITQWFSIKVDNHEGFYARHDTKDITEFVGIGYAPNRSVLQDYRESVSHNISTALIESISPNI